jgi:hypothetical protein
MIKQEPAVWEIPHEYYFDTKTPVTAAALADNLTGMEAMLRAGAVVMSRVLDTTIKDTEILVKSIELQSYKDRFVFRLFFGTGKKAEEKLEKFREALKLKNMDGRTLANFAIAASVLYGAYLLHQSKGSTPETEVAFNNSFNNMAVEVGMSGDEVKELLESAIKGKEEHKKNAARVIKPDGQDTKGRMVFDNNDALTIPPEVVAAVPQVYKKDDVDNSVRTFTDTAISIRALDLDHPERGWAGIVTEVSDKRVKVTLGENIDPRTIPAGKSFKADITVEYKLNKRLQKVPSKITLDRKY